MKKLPLGIQTFKNIIEEEYLYVDKTKDFFSLISGSGKYFFLSRPRRFGKSLLVSTLKEIFSGNRELFKNLWIYDQIDWKAFPVIHLDFSTLSYKTPDMLEKELELKVKKIAIDFGTSLSNERNFKGSFQELIEKLSEREKVVILIDEYDKPIIDYIDNPELAKQNREILKNFFEVIKASDQFLRFVFLTGVSKFSKVSVFSGLNNLRDITLSAEFSTILGYTQKELEKSFAGEIHNLAENYGISSEYLLKEIKNWYNGYSWDGENFVYNPYSILSLFVEKKFENFWFTSGTPAFLIKKIKEFNINIETLEKLNVGRSILESYDSDNINVASLLFQTGYLTVKKIQELSFIMKEYELSYPNLEVKESLLRNILDDFSGIKNDTEILVNKLVTTLLKNNPEEFFSQLKSLFASIPSNIFINDREAYYHSIIYLVLTLIGVRINTEVHTNKGRIDAVIETENTIYIFEFKLGSADEALAQIQDRKYYERFTSTRKKVKLIGVGFDIAERNIKDYLIYEPEL